MLNFFDFPQPARLAGDRPTTAVTSQTLFLLNGPLLKAASQKLAQELLLQTELTSDAERVASVYLRVLNRPPTSNETTAVQTFLTTTDETVAGEISISADMTPAWQRLIHALMASNEFLFRL